MQLWNETVLFIFIYLLEVDDVDQSVPSETELFTKYYNEWKGAGKGKTKSYDAIPRFYFKVILDGLLKTCGYVVVQRFFGLKFF